MAIKLAPDAFDFPETAAPATPPSGYVRLYAKSDNLLYSKDDAGVETALGGGSGSFTDFTLAADSGTPETVADGNTVTITGGTGIDTSVGATDTVTVAVDSTVIRTTGTQSIGVGLTVTSPTIADFTNMAHDHLDADDGGTLSAAAIASGTLVHERGGLEADVSAYNGLVKISAGATSAVTAPSGAIVGDTDSQTLTNKTLTTPTIASFTNATHNHTNAAGGGQLTDAALSSAVGIAKGGTGQTTQTAAFDALAPTTTKGDIIVSNGTDNIRLPVGTDGYVLTADSGETSGVKWDVAPSGASVSGANKIHKFASTQSTTSTVMTDVDATNAAITATTYASGYALVIFSFGCNKATAGSGYYRLTDGSTSSTEVEIVQSTPASGPFTLQATFPTSSGSTTYKLQYRSSDANTVQVLNTIAMNMSVLAVG